MFSLHRGSGYQQKGLVAELVYLFVIGVLSPFVVGLQIFDQFTYTLSLVLLNVLQFPAIILFYRVYLPYTVGKKKYLLALGLFPVYILIYELGSRLSSILSIQLPFVPQEYRNRLASAHPEDLTQGYFNQSLGYTCLVLLAATSLYVLKLLFKNEHNLNTVENEKLKLELSQLKAQVQPHFLLNTLNNIYSLSIQQSQKTPQMIEGLSSIMRYVLYDSSLDKVKLEQEVEFIRNYLHLQGLRHSGGEEIDFQVQGNLDEILIEPLLLVPLVENTFKHALDDEGSLKWIRFILSIDEKELVFQTSNPKSLKTPKPEMYSGIGLENLKKRLALLYPNRYELTIHNEADTFTVTLLIKFYD